MFHASVENHAAFRALHAAGYAEHVETKIAYYASGHAMCHAPTVGRQNCHVSAVAGSHAALYALYEKSFPPPPSCVQEPPWRSCVVSALGSNHATLLAQDAVAYAAHVWACFKDRGITAAVCHAPKAAG